MRSTTRSTIVRWTVRVLGGLALTLVAAVAAVYALSERRMHRRIAVPSHALAVGSDSAAVARGEHLVQARGCIACHGAQLGGRVELDNLLIGRLAGPNLTRGGRGKDLTDADWERAVRHGVRRDSTPLFVMPAVEHTGMTDEDLAAIIAYARSLTPDEAKPPKSRAGPVLRALFLAGVASVLSAEEIDHAKAHPARIEQEPTANYGAYLAPLCAGCHGPNYSGGKIPGGPPEWKPAANITPGGIGHYTETDFIRALREGKRPDGSAIDPQMPWKVYANMNDTELSALYAYLRSLEPRPYGNR